MSPEQAIHELWAATPALVALVPAEKFITGWQEPEDEFKPATLPFAALEQESEADVETSSSRIRRSTILFRFHVYTAGMTELKIIRELIEDILDDFDQQWDGGAIMVMTQDDVSQIRQANGVWHLAMDYQTRARRQMATTN